MSISINATPVSGGTFTVSAVGDAGVNVSTDTADSVNLTVAGGVGPPGAGNVALAAGTGILVTSTANVATITCTVEGVPESVIENLSNVLSGNATAGDVLAWNGTKWAADSNYATLTYVDTAVSNLVDAAPGALDTLNELAAAIGDDANFSATITTSLAGKAAANHTHTSADITDFATAAAANAPLQTINGLTGGVVISNGTGLALTASGSTLTLSASGGGVSSLDMGTYPRIGSLLTEGGDTLTSEAGDQISPEQSISGPVLQLLRSNVAAAVPASLAAGELAINSEDGLLFYANTTGVVQSFALGGYATENHTHEIANVIGLQTALDAKAATASLANVATSGNYTDLGNIPSEFSPTSHASSHATSGSDALAPSDIGAAPAASPTFTGTVGIGTDPSAFSSSFNNLVVGNGSSVEGMTIYSSTQGTLAFGDTATTGADGYRGYIAYIHAADYMVFGTGGVERLRANATGIVVTGRITVSAGAAAAPAITSGTGTSDTGVFWPAADTFAVSTAGTERLRVDSSGNVGIGTTSPSASLDIDSDKIRLRTTKTPASAGDTGNAGDICWDSSYLYICTATDTWRRIAHSTW